MNATQLAALNRLTVVEAAIRFAWKHEDRARYESEAKELKAVING